MTPQDTFSPLLAEFALKGTAILVLAWVASLAVRKAGAALRHLLWLWALAGLLALPVVSALLPGWQVLPGWRQSQATGARTVAAPISPAPTVLPNFVNEEKAAMTGSNILKPGQLIGRSVAQMIRDGIALAWVVGFVALCVRLVAGYRMLARRARKCIAVQSGRIREWVELNCRRLDVRHPIELKLDPDRTIPIVYGILRPRLLLPAEAVEWDEERLRCVLLHEIAHIKRSDPAVQLLAQLSCALYWFNLLVWLAARRLHAEAEGACDDLVLGAGVRGSDYAEQLLHFARAARASNGLFPCGLAMAQPSRLEGRLQAVLNERQNRNGPTRLAAFVALLIGLSLLIPLAMIRAAEEKQHSQPIQRTSADEEKPKTPARAEGAAATQDYNADTRELNRIRVEQAEKELKRAEELYQQKAISQSDYEAAKYAVERRRAELAKSSNWETDAPGASAQSARADVEVAAAELALTRATLKRISLLADQKAVSQVEKEHAEAEVAFAEAKLRLAKSRLERMGAPQSEANNVQGEGVKAKPDTEVLEAELNLAKVTVDTARVRLERVAKLVEQGVVPRDTLEEAKMDVDRAEAQLKLQNARLESARKTQGY